MLHPALLLLRASSVDVGNKCIGRGRRAVNRLHSFRTDNGEPLATPPETMCGFRRARGTDSLLTPTRDDLRPIRHLFRAGSRGGRSQEGRAAGASRRRELRGVRAPARMQAALKEELDRLKHEAVETPPDLIER